MINYTIIIPHKNAFKYLQRCLDSIPEREDIQIIVVDDNSDNIIVDDFPGINKKNIEIYFTRENKGAGYARNVGLSYAKGKWLLFADADDFFNLGFLNVLDNYIDSDNDIIYFSANSINIDTGKKSHRNKKLVDTLSEYLNETKKNKDILIYRNWEPWSKMFNLNFIQRNNIKFEEVRVGNDALFVINAGMLAKKINVDISEIYCVTYNKRSLTFIVDEDLFDARFLSKIKINNFLSKLNKEQYKLSLGSDIVASSRYGLKKTINFIKIARKNNNKIFYASVKAIIDKLF
ncbi:glycosyltransferase family 2 protein [uncultured Apibacter sp.]|uniref:glycosyltransferase family 2 protein n=1 Tax=uncultured Apibacter sp. TaxID=1778616 RepID=UPI0025F819C9|nr:glycosyltransferase family 2 protein [uncultured Apibacter sp.]